MIIRWLLHCPSSQTFIRVAETRCSTGSVWRHMPFSIKRFASSSTVHKSFVGDTVTICEQSFRTDKWTNVSPKVLSKIGVNLHNTPSHPLYLIRMRIQDFFYKRFMKGTSPVFSVYDKMSPVVTPEQNFDSLLVPKDHVSRLPSDSYYLNGSHMLRAHTSAHQTDLIRMGLDNFLLVGDVYRRDEIDRTHYPVFHQMEGVRLVTNFELFKDVPEHSGFRLFEKGKHLKEKQWCHTIDAAMLMEHALKSTLEDLAHNLFGKDIETKWVDCYFPFTHPSWELEIKFNGDWLEVLGCGIMQQELLHSAGAGEKIGWAFGLGLERLAMRLFDIPDIRLFWSRDSGFLSQFAVDNPYSPVKYKPISQYPQCINDISFWIPEKFTPNDFYDIARNVGGDLIEQISLVDEFFNQKTKRRSHCYKIVYRHLEKTMTQTEVNEVHKQIEDEAVNILNVEIR